MKHVSIQRCTPNSTDMNRGGAQPINDNTAIFPPRKISRRFNLPRGRNSGSYSGSVFPNGEFTIGYVGFKKRGIEESRYDRGEVAGFRGVSPEPDSVEVDGCSIPIPQDERTFSTPILVNPSELSQPKRSYGKNGITAHGRRMVRNAADRIQSVYSRKRTGFFTLTLPDFPDVIRKAIAENWGTVLKKYFQELFREHDRHKKEFSYVAVTEIQARRWEKTGNPGFHIHYCTPIYRLSGKRGDYFITADWVRATWRRILQNFVDTIPLDGVCFEVPQPRVDCQRVRESAGAYLSKYMSKGGELIEEVIREDGEQCIPRQWWSVSSSLRKWVIAHIQNLAYDVIESVFHLLRSPDNPFILYSSQILINHPARGEIVVAVSGRISAIGMSALGLSTQI